MGKFSEDPLQRPFLSIEIQPLSGKSLFDFVEREASFCEMWFRFGEKKDVWGLKRKERKVTSSGNKYFDVVCIDGELGSDVRDIYFGNGHITITLEFHYPWLYKTEIEEVISSFRFVG